MPEYNVEFEMTIVEVGNIVADSPEDAERIAREKGWSSLSNGIGNWDITKQSETTIDVITATGHVFDCECTKCFDDRDTYFNKEEIK